MPGILRTSGNGCYIHMETSGEDVNAQGGTGPLPYSQTGLHNTPLAQASLSYLLLLNNDIYHFVTSWFLTPLQCQDNYYRRYSCVHRLLDVVRRLPLEA